MASLPLREESARREEREVWDKMRRGAASGGREEGADKGGEEEEERLAKGEGHSLH